MTNVRLSMMLGAGLTLLSTSGAIAADIYGGSIKDSGYVAPMAAPGPSVYFRIDGGYGHFDRPFMTEDGIVDLSEASIDNTWTVGGGVGIYFSRNFRADLTYDHRFKADASAYRYDASQNQALGADCDTGSAGIQTACFGTRKFGISSDVFLANVYYDFDTGGRFTPYIGGGLGIARNKTHAGTVSGVGPNGNVAAGTIESATNNHVAGALMAGVSMQLRDRLSFDAGYRFLYLGEVSTGPVKDVSGIDIAGDPKVQELHAHEFRVGLRYDLR